MISAIIDTLNAKLSLLTYFEKRYCLTELKTETKGEIEITSPVHYVGSEDWEKIQVDKYRGVSYWRKDGQVSVERSEDLGNAKDFVTVTFPFKLVAYVKRQDTTIDDEYSPDRIANALVKQLNFKNGEIKTTLKAKRVISSVTDYSTDSAEIWEEETNGTGLVDVPFKFAVVSLSVEIEVLARIDCLETECEQDSDILHAFNFCLPSVQDRLTDEQKTCLEDFLCAPCLDATVTNQAEDYSLSIASGATEKLPFGKVKNKEGNDVQVDYKPAADGYIFEETACPTPDPATVTINGDSLGATGTVPSGGTVDIDVVQNSSPVGSWNGSEWVVPPNTGGYVRPSDWIALPYIVAGENKLAGAVAVFDIDNNYITIRATTDSGTWSVNWGDGNTTTGIASGVTAEHKLSYAGATGALTTRGYKTALVVVTADSGNFTLFDLLEPHSESTQRYYAPWLDIKLAGSSISSFDIYSTNPEAQMKMLEQFDWIGGNAMTNAYRFFRYCQALRRIVNFDTSGWTNAIDFIRDTQLIQTPVFNTSSLNTLRTIFSYAPMDELVITDSAQITDNNGLFQAFSNALCRKITIQNTGVGNTGSATLCFANTPNLNCTPDLGDTSGITNWTGFCDNSGIKVMEAHDLSGATSMGNWVRNCPNISRMKAYGATVTHSIANCNMGVAALEEYATNLGDGTGQTITTSGNPGSGSWDTTIATNKNWTVVD